MSAGMISVPTIIPLKEPGSVLAGSRKWMINTNTLIDLHSNTKECVLFYTIDGTKPDPFQRLGNRTTRQFLKPFALPAGKKTVKAIAVLKDGSRESSVNTKVFQVDVAEENSDDDDVDLVRTSWATQDNLDDEPDGNQPNKLFKGILRDDEPDGNETNKLFKGILRLSPSRKGDTEEEKKNDIIKRVLTDSPIPPTSGVFPRQTQDDDSFRCFHCNAPRPYDRDARFCNGCGMGLPPAPGGIRTSQYFTAGNVYCENCGYEKVSDTAFCRVCDSLTKCSKPSKQRINCKNCDSMNPISVDICLVCDEPLDNHFLQNNMIDKSIVHKPCNEFIQCPFCERVNSDDARFCDWCGKNPQTAPVTICCERCKADNSLYSEYCCTCGNIIETPMRKSFTEHMNKNDLVIENGNLNKESSSKNTQWRKVKLQKTAKRPTKSVSVQVGENFASKMSPSKGGKSNVLSNYSPGKGYWRQQVDHICHHLKVYTQNNLEFREAIANHVMSKMLSAIVAESEKLELIITLKLALKEGGNSNKSLRGTASALTFISALTTSVNNSKPLSNSRPSSARSRPGSARSRPTSARSTGSRPSSARKKKKSLKTYEKIGKEKVNSMLSKLSSESLKVLTMIKSTKTVVDETVEELTKSTDFDANTNDENNIPLLKLAVINKRFQFIPPLVNAGADVDKLSGSQMTSALHEAVSLGVNGRDGVSALIESGASPDVKDSKGRTAFDLAVESGIESLIEKFTKLTSKQMLNDVKF